ncbi:hypothetical protein [Halodesulfovibrio sp.]|uniref:hypothetical protein n=1 Tax=Halodesulfovibrio sp. TaxID=1912772 RepID=UPI0025BC4DDB|nr:hypothetical protein [Halodesulfovibrio sp.]
MKFITEDDLRALYRKDAFTDFNVTKDEKLTPGARQFLTDRRITILADGVPTDTTESSTSTFSQTSVTETVVEPEPAVNDWRTMRLRSELTSITNSFLLIACELQARDIRLSQSVAALEQDVAAMLTVLDDGVSLQDLDCEECHGITKANFSSPLADCFAITSEHMLPPNGKEVLLLNQLRCSMYRFEAILAELYEETPDENRLGIRVNQIRNILSQMICTALGGKECQRIE